MAPRTCPGCGQATLAAAGDTCSNCGLQAVAVRRIPRAEPRPGRPTRTRARPKRRPEDIRVRYQAAAAEVMKVYRVALQDLDHDVHEFAPDEGILRFKTATRWRTLVGEPITATFEHMQGITLVWFAGETRDGVRYQMAERGEGHRIVRELAQAAEALFDGKAKAWKLDDSFSGKVRIRRSLWFAFGLMILAGAGAYLYALL